MNRPAAAPRRLRRPAAAVAKAAPKRARHRPPAVGGSAEERYKRGEEVAADELSLAWLTPGAWVQTHRGVYGGEPTVLAGKIKRVIVEGVDKELEVELTGTRSETLLRYATGQSPAVIRIHLCPASSDS